MNEDNKNSFDLLIDSIRLVVREEIAAGLVNVKPNEPDRLLTAEEAAAIVGRPGKKGVRWVYRNLGKLPFARRISRKNLRFYEPGLRRWTEAKRPGSR